MAHEETLFVVAGFDEPAGGAFGAITADFLVLAVSPPYLSNLYYGELIDHFIEFGFDLLC